MENTVANERFSENPKTPPLLNPQKKNLKIILIPILIIIAVLLGTAVYYLKTNNVNITADPGNPPETWDNTKPHQVQAAGFAQYREIPVNINASVPKYSVQANLANISNASDFSFSQKAKKLLVDNAFVVVPGYNDEFFPLYESNRYSYIPNFITTDSMLHNYHLMFDYLLKNLEEERLAGELKNLTAAMLSASLTQYESLKNTDWETAAKRTVGFFSVGSALLNPSVNIPPIVSKEVQKELTLIEAHQGIEKSPVMNIGLTEETILDTPQGPQSIEALKEDYSQYIPRGHYDKTEELKAYFKTMMWYGRITFRMKSEDEVKSALFITLILNEDNNRKAWDRIFEPVNFFVGKSDDITYYQFRDLISEVYGPKVSLSEVKNDSAKFALFREKVKSIEPPKINSMPIFEASIQEDREEEIKGFRFMGQRFTIDASIFQRLLYREVGDKKISCPDYKPENASCLTGARCLPQGLDIPAGLGSREAEAILKDMGETEYTCYLENLSAVKEYISRLPQEVWTQNLYWGWLYQLRPLLETKGEGYPAFMKNSAWQRKDLNTFLGSWSELKHDTILYAKQAYAEMGAGMPEEKDDRGYVEPNVLVYSRLASLLKMTGEGLNSRGILSAGMKDNLERLEKLALALKTISEKELASESLTDAEYELIRSFGGQLEHFWLEVNKNEPAFKESDQRKYLNENPAAIISDFATDPNGSVKEAGTGKIFDIYAVVPVDGKLKIAKGGVYSYYEFTWPLNDRLTDKKWREILNSLEAPELPQWTDAFLTD